MINFMLMFGLCSAYGMIMFSDDWHAAHRGLGVKMNLFTASIMGVLLAGASKVKVAIGGPDLNPVVFLGGFVTTIAEELAADRGLAYGSDASVGFCVGQHLLANAADCADYHEQLRATTIFATTVSTGFLTIFYIGLGRFKSHEAT